MPRRLSLVMLVGFAAAGCEWHSVADIYGGPAGLAAVESPTKVEAFRVGEMSTRSPGDPATIHGFPILSGPVAVDAATARRLASLLADRGTYQWNVDKACEFSPGVAVRFTGSRSSTDVLFCFDCSILAAYRDGSRVGTEDFDPGRFELVAVMQALFPDDEVIQKLE